MCGVEDVSSLPQPSDTSANKISLLPCLARFIQFVSACNSDLLVLILPQCHIYIYHTCSIAIYIYCTLVSGWFLGNSYYLLSSDYIYTDSTALTDCAECLYNYCLVFTVYCLLLTVYFLLFTV